MLLYQGFIRPSYDYPGIQGVRNRITRPLYRIWKKLVILQRNRVTINNKIEEQHVAVLLFLSAWKKQALNKLVSLIVAS